MALCAREAGGAVLALTVMKEERIAEGSNRYIMILHNITLLNTNYFWRAII